MSKDIKQEDLARITYDLPIAQLNFSDFLQQLLGLDPKATNNPINVITTFIKSPADEAEDTTLYTIVSNDKGRTDRLEVHVCSCLYDDPDNQLFRFLVYYFSDVQGKPIRISDEIIKLERSPKPQLDPADPITYVFKIVKHMLGEGYDKNLTILKTIEVFKNNQMESKAFKAALAAQEKLPVTTGPKLHAPAIMATAQQFEEYNRLQQQKQTGK